MKDKKDIRLFDLECSYFQLLDTEGESALFSLLKDEIAWENEQVKSFGKMHVLRRKTAFYGNEGLSYRYSGIEKKTLLWTESLLHLKNDLQNFLKEPFNCALLNYYPSGNESMGWHSDDEKEHDPNSPIVSLSLGTKRVFSLRHKKDPQLKVQIPLEPGYCLVMRGKDQNNWQHALLASKKIEDPRINISFRNFKIQSKF